MLFRDDLNSSRKASKVMEITPNPKVHHMTASVLSEARGHVAALIGPQAPGAKLKASWPRLARLLGTTERRVRAIWNGEARAIRADEMDTLREAVARKNVANVALIDAARLETAATALAQVDPDFHRQDIELYRDLARHLRSQAQNAGKR
jgi:hypothetical protein